MTKRTMYTLLLVLVTASLACGGGGGSDGGMTGGTGVAGTFSPAQANPGPDTVSMGQQSASGNLVTVAVNLTDTASVYGALFDMTYPASFVEYVSWSPGTVLEAGGQQVNYIVDAPTSGRLVISASRLGAAPETNVTGTETLIRITFRVTRVGSGSVGFENSAIVDEQLQDLPIQLWAGGTLGAS